MLFCSPVYSSWPVLKSPAWYKHGANNIYIALLSAENENATLLAALPPSTCMQGQSDTVSHFLPPNLPKRTREETSKPHAVALPSPQLASAVNLAPSFQIKERERDARGRNVSNGETEGMEEQPWRGRDFSCDKTPGWSTEWQTNGKEKQHRGDREGPEHDPPTSWLTASGWKCVYIPHAHTHHICISPSPAALVHSFSKASP